MYVRFVAFASKGVYVYMCNILGFSKKTNIFARTHTVSFVKLACGVCNCVIIYTV